MPYITGQGEEGSADLTPGVSCARPSLLVPQPSTELGGCHEPRSSSRHLLECHYWRHFQCRASDGTLQFAALGAMQACVQPPGLRAVPSGGTELREVPALVQLLVLALFIYY